VFERSLIASAGRRTAHATSVGYNLRALRSAASAVRERLSQEQWNIIVQAETVLPPLRRSTEEASIPRGGLRSWNPPARTWPPSPARRPTA
jgi:uncharacterized alpha-E superfamily protein